MAARLLGAVVVTAVLCSAVAAAERQPPPVGLLEFIADFETAGGRAVDPLQFAAPAGEKQAAKREVKPKKQQGRTAPVGTKGVKP